MISRRPGRVQLGNVTQVTMPGKDDADPVTITYNYATDAAFAGQPAFSQTPALGQPLVMNVLDMQGDTLLQSHYRYNSLQGLLTASIDALGNETDIDYVSVPTLTSSGTYMTLEQTGRLLLP